MADETFQKDQRVIFRRGAQWYEGKVASIINFNPIVDVLSYIVEEFDPSAFVQQFDQTGKSYAIPCGHENIRLLPFEDDPYKLCKTPIFHDPQRKLYMESGHIKIPPKHEIEGLIDPQNIEEMVQVVSFRRKIAEGSIINITKSPLEILESILPDLRLLHHWDASEKTYCLLRKENLEDLAKTDNRAMLQLADAHRFGLLGYPKSIRHNLYLLAATGLKQDRLHNLFHNIFEWDFGYPMGNGEALTACAYEWWSQKIAPPRGRPEGTSFYYNQALVCFKMDLTSPESPQTIHVLKMITAALSHAIRRGWTSPFTVAFAKALSKHEYLVTALHPHSIVLESLVNPLNVQRPILEDMRGTVTGYHLQRFAPKATEIFLGLPVKKIHGQDKDSTDIHVEYRKTFHNRMAINVFTFNQEENYSVILPDELEFTPFSKDAIEYMWGCVVFASMHRGDYLTGERYRPSLITFADRPIDRLFALSVKEHIGGDDSGTKIKIVDPRTHKIVYRKKKMFLNKVLEPHRKKMMRAQKRDEELSHTSIDQDSRNVYTCNTISVEELCSKAESLKREGDKYFETNRIQAAKRCYTKAIDDIKMNVNANDEKVLILLGTLLCDRASSFRKMAEGMGPHSSKQALMNGVTDCEKALKTKSCMRVLPLSRKKKIEALKQRLSADLDRIALPEDIITVGRTPPEPFQSPKRGRKKVSKKEKQKQKRKQRRKKRELRNQQEERRDDFEVIEQNSDQDDDRELISIVTGNDLWESQITPFVSGREDTCPCCFDRFSVELDGVFCAVNPCGHACCLPCLSKLKKKKKSQKGSEQTAFNCPVCRVPLQNDILSDAVDPILSCTPGLQNRISSLPLNGIEGKQVAKELCLQHDFKIPNVLCALDVMLTDGLQASLRSSSELNASQKQKIYEKARKPVDELWMEAKSLRSEMDLAYDFESKSYQTMRYRLIHLQNRLIPAATQTAADYIWEKMNSAGRMGVQDMDTGEIEIDFHALRVNEAKDRFRDRVLPILPAVESVLLVVGRGNHSEGGIAKLKPALKKLIEDHSKTRYSRVEGNDGVIRVQWVN